MLRHLLVAITFLGALLPAGAVAQAPLAPEFVTFLRSNPYATYIHQRLNEYEPPSLKADCPELKLISRKNLSVLALPQFAAGSSTPESGQWIDQAIVDRCGTRGQRSLLVIVRGPRQLQAVAMLPGETVTSPLLQRDAMLSAMVGATAQIRCDIKETRVIDTTVVGEVVPNATWLENWTFAGCGKTVVLAITFTPDGKGGTHFSTTAKP